MEIKNFLWRAKNCSFHIRTFASKPEIKTLVTRYDDSIYIYITMNVTNQIWQFFLDVIIYKILMVQQTFIGLAYKGKEIVFRFIIEYSSLRDFGP